MKLIEVESLQLHKGLQREFLPQRQPVRLNRIQRKKVIVISGPTAVGKTKISLKVAKKLGGEIISADSMQVYRHMNIGTAKISPEEMDGIPHHLIDTRELIDKFTVADFFSEAGHAISDILKRGKVPIIVGGTGFYIHALLYGPPQGPPSVPEVRAKIEAEMEEKGSDHLYRRLQKLDPTYAATITARDKHKIVRALEIIAVSNEKVSHFPISSQEMGEKYNFRCWFLHKPREILYDDIEKRCEKMIADGFLSEVEMVSKMGLKDNLSASQAIGYRQGLEFLASDQGSDQFIEFVANFKRASKRYAKRQFTWFRKEALFRWLDVSERLASETADIIAQDYELSL